MLTVEIRDVERASAGGAEVEIFCDAEGLALLLHQLEHLKSGPNHIHFMTPSWAGNELEEKTVGERTVLVNHVRVTLLPTPVDTSMPD